MENVTQIMTDAPLNGAVTVWVRYPLQFDATTGTYSEQDSTNVVVTAEGTAPFVGGGLTTVLGQVQRATRMMEATLRVSDLNNGEADPISGPQSGGSQGTNTQASALGEQSLADAEATLTAKNCPSETAVPQ